MFVGIQFYPAARLQIADGLLDFCQPAVANFHPQIGGKHALEMICFKQGVDKMDFKQKLQAIRAEMNLSQEEMAEVIGVSRQAVAKWETGQSYPDIENLLKISDLLKVSLDRLLRPDIDDCRAGTVCIKENNLDEIIGFLCRAKKATYAGEGNEEKEPCRPYSHDFKYEESKYFYMDTYLGGERFSGQEAVWKDGVPIWTMNYCGRVLSPDFNGAFLKEALSFVTEKYPYRGPLVYINGGFSYHCIISGGFEWFQGYEEIFYKDRKVMESFFHGGAVQ